MFAHRGHIEALTQPRSLQPGSSPVLGSVARDSHDGCIDSRLRSSVRGNASFGTVAGISEPVAHKPPGAGSSLLSSKGFSATAGTAACTDSHRQHVCGFVYKSPERNSLKGRCASRQWTVFLFIRAAYIPGLLIRGADMFSRDSSRRVEFAP